MDENNLFLKTIEQKYERFEDYYTLMSSDFLSLEQQSMLSGFMRAHSRDGVFFTEDTMMPNERWLFSSPITCMKAPQRGLRNGLPKTKTPVRSRFLI